jgi:hypothetical protein
VAQFSRLAWLFFAVAGSAACGGRAFEAGDPSPSAGSGNDAGSASGGSGNVAGTAHGGTTGKAGSTSGGTAQGGTGGSVCESFDDQPGRYISVAIYNKTAAAIHLGEQQVSCEISPLFDVNDAQGAALKSPSGCRGPCQALRQGGPIGCDALCAYPSAVTLQPGEVLHTTWDGLYEVEAQLPAQCLAAGQPGMCTQARAIAPGKFTFSALAGSSLDCSTTVGGSCGSCVATGNGGCTTNGSLIAGTLHEATTTVVLDSSYGVFGPSPAPLPGNPPADADAPGGAMAFLTVELVFTQ